MYYILVLDAVQFQKQITLFYYMQLDNLFHSLFPCENFAVLFYQMS